MQAWIYHRFSIESNSDWIYGGSCHYSLPSAAQEPSWNQEFHQEDRYHLCDAVDFQLRLSWSQFSLPLSISILLHMIHAEI